LSSAQTALIPENATGAIRLASSPLITCLVLAVATAFAFWPVLQADFINYDDPDYVTDNPHVQSGLTWENTEWAFRTTHASNWHPLTWLSHMLDVQLFGKGPVAPHAVNLLLHVLNTTLLFGLLRQITGAHWRSFVVAGLFGLHPLHVESVAWVAERKDVLSSFFGLLTLLAYAHYAKQSTSWNSRTAVKYTLSVLCFALALLSKPMLVTLPFAMLLLDFWPLQRLASGSVVRMVAEKLPFLMLSAASSAVTVVAQQNAMQPLIHLPMLDRIGNALVAYARYLGSTIWPVDLALPYLLLRPWPVSEVILAGALIFGLSAFAFRSRHRFPFLVTGWFWFLGTLVPVIGLVQVGAQAMADRYTYLPLIGVFTVVAWSAARAASNMAAGRVAIPVVGSLILIGCATMTRQQVNYWRNSETLFTHSAAVTENNYLAWCNLAGSLFDRGKLDEAMDCYQRALRINPNHADALNSIGAILAAKGDETASNWFGRTLLLQPEHADALFNMGNAMIKQGLPVEAVAYYQRALKKKPGDSQMRNNLANSLLKIGKTEEALSQYRLALQDNPEDSTVLKNLASILAAQGQFDQAISFYRQSLARQPTDAAAHYGLGLAHAVKGRWPEAIAHYQATLRLSPTNAEAEYNLGYALKVQGQRDEAATHLSTALRLKPEFPLAHFNLACVLAEMNQRDKSVAHLREALRLKPDYREALQMLRSLEQPP
jgi:protein O-mannosyl-transferase